MQIAVIAKKWRFLIFVILSGMSAFAKSAELSISDVGDGLKVHLKNIEYPENIIQKELSNGLPNEITLLVSITQQGKVISAESLSYQITYDLWDEVFRIQNLNDEKSDSAPQYMQRQELLTMLSNLTLTSRAVIFAEKPNAVYQLQAKVLVNPVKTERINKIKDWLATSQGRNPENSDNNPLVVGANSTPSVRLNNPQNQGRSAGSIINHAGGQESVASVRPRFQKLFDQILEQYVTQGAIPALWQSDVISTEFTPRDLPNEPKNH